MANDNNQPLLHFGDDSEYNNNEQAPISQIRFGSSDDEGIKEEKKVAQEQPKVTTPKAQPTASVQAPAPKPQPVAPKSQPVAPKPQPVAPTPASKPANKPQVSPVSKADDSFGKKNMRINLIVVNGAGVVIPQFKIDHTLIKSGQEITFSDSREVYEITVSADGYKERRVQITQTDLIKGEKRISLATQLQSLVVSFNTPDGIKRGHIDIDQTNAIYEFVKEASHTDTPLNELVIGGVGGHKPAPVKNPFLPYIIAMVIGLVLGIGISSLFSCGGSDDKDKTEVVPEEGQTEDVEVKDDEVKPSENDQTLNPEPQQDEAEETKAKEEEAAKESDEQKQQEAANATMSEADVKYLKEKDVWKRGEATGEEAKKLLAAFCSGNIETITGANSYNALPEKQRNGYYNKVLNDLNRIKNQSNSEDAKAAIREICSGGDINLNKILNRIHPMLMK